MASVEEVLAAERPSSAASAPLARRAESYASPPDWRDEVLYFLLPDRFSDEKSRALLQRRSEDDLWAARPGGREGWRWNAWAESGAHRFQGGTLRGAARRLDYLQRLGVTVGWSGP